MAQDINKFQQLLSTTPHWLLWGIILVMLGLIVSPFDLISGDAFTAIPTAGITLVDDGGYLIVALLGGFLEFMKIRNRQKTKNNDDDIYDSDIVDN